MFLVALIVFYYAIYLELELVAHSQDVRVAVVIVIVLIDVLIAVKHIKRVVLVDFDLTVVCS